MESRFEPEQPRVEPRFHADTVQKAVALAQRLQQERRETLSLSEIDQIASEIGIDPAILRQALHAIAEKETTSAAGVRDQMSAHTGVAQQHRRSSSLALIAALGFGGLLIPMWLLVRVRAASQTPPPPIQVMAPAPPTEVVTSSITNGDFSLGPGKTVSVPAGSELIPGWTVASGQVTYLQNSPTSGTSGALQLREGASVRQLFQTTPGLQYQLRVRVSGTPRSVNSMGRIQIVIGNSSSEVAAFTPAKGTGVAQWAEGVLPFVAQETGTTVEITRQNRQGEESNPIIDDVTLEPINSTVGPLSR